MGMIASWFGQAVLGWLIADFLSGIGHWFEDRVARTDWPLVGKEIVEPNRLHHREPLKFTQGTYWRRNTSVTIIAFAIAVFWYLTLGPSITWFFATLGGATVNEVHAWAHRPDMTPRWAQAAQEMGVLQSPPHHAGHHRGEHDRRYCILTNWLNPILDRLKFWDRVEGVLTLIGLEPNRGTA